MLATFNFVEGVLWCAIALVMAVAAFRYRGHRDLVLIACALFVAFGASDFVEMTTGAWYHPWWLLAWKAVNVMGLVAVYVVYRRRRAGSQDSEAGDRDESE